MNAIVESRHTPAVVEAFARAVLKPRAQIRTIDANNQPGAVVSLEEAVNSGQAFMGDLRDGVIVFDCDANENPQDWAPAGRAALEQIGCTVVRTASGSPGSEHHWFVGPVGWSSELLKLHAIHAGMPKDQIRGGTWDCRPPLSPHREGRPVSLLEPADAETALALLTGRPNATGFDEELWSYVLEHGDAPDGRYEGKRHRALLGLAVALVNAGGAFETFSYRAMQSKRLASKIEEAGPGLLASTWTKAGRFVRDSPPQPGAAKAATLAALRATTRSYPWGARNDLDRRVYSYLVEQALPYGWDVISKNQRTIAQAVGRPHSTVNAAIQRLIRAKFLEVTVAGSRRQSTTYRLLPKDVASGPRSKLTPPAVVKDAFCSASSEVVALPDLFRGHLPRASFDTWRAMPAGQWVTVKRLTLLRPGAVNAPTVLRHLRALISVGLVDRNAPRGQKWLVVPHDEAALAQAAISYGVAGHTELHNEQIERERDTHKKFWAGASAS